MTGFYQVNEFLRKTVNAIRLRGLFDPLEKPRVGLKLVIKPVVLSDQDAGRFSVTGYDDLLLLGLTKES